MSNINLNLDNNSLYELLKNYYELSKIKTAIFDEQGRKLITYPDEDCDFCKMMKSNKATKQLCNESDKKAFEIVKGKKELIIYHCAAGLVEASAPLIQDNVVIGYMMFGQITNESSKEKLINKVEYLLSQYDMVLENKEICNKIKYRSENQIKAAAKLLEACTFYVLLKEYIKLSNKSFIDKLNVYIDENMSKEISITDLTSYFKISKNKLYDQFGEFSNIGIAQYIKLKKIEKAKELLIDTNMKIIAISAEVGFYDYNYFCRVFKKIVGTPAKQYRKQFSNIK